MTLYLDVRTSALFSAVVLLLMTGAMILMWRTSPENREARLWASGYAMICLGILLIALRGVIPIFLSVVLSNTLVITGLMLLMEGIRVFFGKPVQWSLVALVSCVVTLLFVGFTYVVPEVKARIVVTSVCVTGMGGWIVVELMKEFDRRMALQQGLVTISVAFFCVFMVARVVHVLTGPPIEQFMPLGTPVHSLMFLVAAAIVISLTFGFSAMINRRLQLHLDHLARYDLLTGIYNRRAFEEAVVRELARCQRYGTPLAVLLLDLDYFKRINDRYGHCAGDRVLRQVAKSVKAVLRIGDTLGRIGGEEFCVLLPQTHHRQAAMIAERICSAVAKEPVEYNGQSVVVTVSVGIAMIDHPVCSWEYAFQAADQALYRAKHEGRNRVASIA